MLLYLREQSFDFSVNENLIVLYTTEFLLLLAPTKSCLIIVVILYRYNDLSSICNQNTFDEENFDFQIDTANAVLFFSVCMVIFLLLLIKKLVVRHKCL